MSETVQKHPQLAAKLHPTRFTHMSGQMAAIVAYLIGEEWTDPKIVALSITSDGFLISRPDSGPHVERGLFIGAANDLDRNLTELVKAAELTEEEAIELWALRSSKVEDFSLRYKKPTGG